MKRKLALVCIAVLVIACFAGCSQENAGADSQGSAAEQPASQAEVNSETATEAPAGLTTITWLNVGGANDHQNRINAMASEYLQSKGLPVTLDFQVLDWGNWGEKYSMMMAAGEPLDLINGQNSAMISYGLNGGVMKITDDMLQSYMPDVLSVAGETLIDTLRYQGDLYMVPAMHEWCQYFGMLYNKNIADELGIDMEAVKSVDDLDAIFEKVHAAYPDVTCLLTNYTGGAIMASQKIDVVNSNGNYCLGVELTDDANGVFGYFENEKVIAYLKKLNEWYEKGYLCTDSTIDQSSLRKEGKSFSEITRFKPGSGAQYSTNAVTIAETKFSDEAPIITMNDSPGGWGTAIGTNSRNPELAMQVYNLAFTDSDFLNILNYGELDTDYKLTAEGYVEYIEGGYAETGYDNRCWQTGNQGILLVPKTYADMGLENIWEIQEQFNKSGVAVKSSGFFFNTEMYEAELASISNVYKEYSPLLFAGSADVESTIQEFTDKLYANGFQAVLDGCNEQYKEFLAFKGE